MVTAGNRLVTGVVLASFASCAGCATTATITRTDAPDTEAEIVRSEPDSLFVRGSNGRIYRLDRASVGDIDHPGNVNMTIGGVMLGFVGLIFLSLSAGERQQGLTPLALIYGLPGLGLLAYGGYQYGRSTSAARAFTEATGPVLRETPPTPPADDRSRHLMPPPRAVDRAPDRAEDHAVDHAVDHTADRPADRTWMPPPPPADAEGPAAPAAEGPSVRRTPHVSAAPRPGAPETPPPAAPPAQ